MPVYVELQALDCDLARAGVGVGLDGGSLGGGGSGPGYGRQGSKDKAKAKAPARLGKLVDEVEDENKAGLHADMKARLYFALLSSHSEPLSETHIVL